MLIRKITDDIAKGESSVSHNGVYTTYCFKASFLFADLVKDWGNFNQSLHLHHFKSALDIGKVPGLEITLHKSKLQSVIIPLGSADSYQAHAQIRLENATFFYRYQSGRGSIIARGTYDLCETRFNLTIERLSDGTVKAIGNSKAPLNVGTMERVFFPSAKTSDLILKAFEWSGLLEARLMRPRMEAYIGKDFSVKFSGDSYLGHEATPIHLEFYCRKLSGGNFLTVGVTSSQVSLNEALKTFTGFQLPYLDLLGRDTNVSRVRLSTLESS